VTSEQDGRFSLVNLTPGTYAVKVEKQGFRAAEVKGIEIVINRTSSITIGLQPGSVSEVVEVSAAAVTVDTTSTAVGTNLSDNFYQAVPVQRNVAGLFYASPGVASGGGTGSANPSISGGSGLENLYVADGVDITDTSFGGLGTYNRVFGSVGTGINLSFIKEVQVKTGGYEPQYGKSTGGIVQIVTKSGTNAYHGAVTVFGAPQDFEAERLHADDFGRTNLLGKRLHNQQYDAAGEFSGYVPGMKDHLYFFGSFNPVWNSNFDIAPAQFGLSSLGTMQLRTNTYNYSAKLTANITDKHTFETSLFGDPAHTSYGAFLTLITLSAQPTFTKLEYGSRNWVARYNGTLTPTWLLNASFSWMHNTFNEGVLDTVDGVPNYQVTDLTQTSGLAGQLGSYRMIGQGFYENTKSNNYGFDINTSKIVHFAGEHTIGLGYKLELPRYDPYKDRSGPKITIPATNGGGSAWITSPDAQAAIGQPDNATFNLSRNNNCTLCPTMTIPGYATPQHVYLSQNRGEFGALSIHTEGQYMASFINDAWTMNKHVTVNLGLRWEQHHLEGEATKYTFTDNWSPRVGIAIDPKGDRKTKIYANFGRYNYAIPLDMAERSLSNELDFYGMRFMPAYTGSGTSKQVVLNQFGAVTVIPDAAHLLNRYNTNANYIDPATGACNGPLSANGCGTGGSPAFSIQSTTAIGQGTRMQYLDEFVVGAEREAWGGVVISGRYIDRRIKRIVEDIAAVSPEGFNAGLAQNYFITNPDKTTDRFHNEKPVKFTSGSVPGSLVDQTVYPGLVTPDAGSCPGSWDSGSGQCFLQTPYLLDPVQDSLGNVVSPGGVGYQPVDANGKAFNGPWFEFGGGDPSDPANYGINPAAFWGGEVGADGIPDGFVNPVRIYQAVEIEANKSFSKNWMMRANWRIAKLFGNYEGAFRNDNGQSDPSISSLFDFTQGVYGLLGAQFNPGVLNTDRRHVINTFVSYTFDKTAVRGLQLGTGVRVESGYPYNDLKAHPAYLNAGEIPQGGRGALGKSQLTGGVDVHAEYAHAITEKTRLRAGIDLFNIANSRRLVAIDQNEDLQYLTPNVDFQKPANYGGARDSAFQRPFYARFMVKFEF
jgi:hypothetical protein